MHVALRKRKKKQGRYVSRWCVGGVNNTAVLNKRKQDGNATAIPCRGRVWTSLCISQLCVGKPRVSYTAKQTPRNDSSLALPLNHCEVKVAFNFVYLSWSAVGRAAHFPSLVFPFSFQFSLSPSSVLCSKYRRKQSAKFNNSEFHFPSQHS